MSALLTREVEAFEGTWEEIVGSHASALSGHRVRVLLLPDPPPAAPRQPLRRGMFASSLPSLDLDDFKIAEYAGDDDSATA